MTDIFKEYESSSSESGDENQQAAQDQMIIQANNVISISKWRFPGPQPPLRRG